VHNITQWQYLQTECQHQNSGLQINFLGNNLTLQYVCLHLMPPDEFPGLCPPIEGCRIHF
jgi:hypothetical protein